MAQVGSNEEWVSIDAPMEYIEISTNDINIDHIEELQSSMNSDEYILYLKSLWSKDRDNNQKVINQQIYKNNQLQKQLDIVKKQNIKLQNELNFMNSKLKHQQNNTNFWNTNTNTTINDNNDNNVVAKLFNVFKSKPTSNSSSNSMTNAKLNQV